MITAYASGRTVEDAFNAGVWHVLPKPVDFPKLLCLIEVTLKSPLVLLVDDDAEFCASLWDLLHEHGYRVSIANNSRQAAQGLRGSTRVVLIDLKLPDRDGDDVFRQVRQANPNARTLLIGGYPAEMESTAQRLKAEGADAICYKPFNIPKLLGTLTELSIA